MSREDLIAQMQGLREELAHAEQYGRTDRADAVRAYMETVRAAGARQADALDIEVERFELGGQHVMAGHRREQATVLRSGLGISGEPKDDETGPETAVESTPRETAVPAKATGRKPARPRKDG